MSFTLLGYLIIPITFILFFMKKSEYLLIFAIFSSVFQAASVINFSPNGFEFGVSPYYFIGVAVLARNCFDVLVYKKIRFKHNHGLNFYLLLGFLTLVSMVLSFLLPQIFNGIEVYNPRLGIDSQLDKRANLTWNTSNLAQCIYMLLNAFMFLKISQMQNIQRNFIVLELAASFFVAVAFFQIALGFFGVGFPHQVFNSNPGYAQLYNQEISGFVRVSSTFTEPSTAAAYISSLLGLFVAHLLKNKVSWLRKTLYFFVFLVTVLTTSTVAIICVFFIATFYCFYQIKKFFTSKKISPIPVLLFFFALFAGLTALPLSPFFVKIINFVLLEKSSTQSFVVRLASDLFSLDLLLKTGGLGVGLGSNRPSSFFTFLLSNLGIFGFAIFSFLIFVTIYFNRFTTHKTYSFTFALVIYLLAKVIAIPDLSDSGFWMIWALAFSTIEFKKPDQASHAQMVAT
jgi:hypothetical protein